MDIAALGIAIDSNPVREADTALAGLTRRSQEAENAAQKLVDQWKEKAATVGKSAREIENYKLALGGATEAQMREIDAARRAVEAHENLQKKLEGARELGLSVGSAIRTGFTVALTAATAFIVGLDQVIKRFADIADIGDKTFAPIEGLVQMQTAADVAGISLNQVGDAMNMMQRQLARGSDEAKGAARGLAAIGLEYETFRALDPATQFKVLAERMADVENNGGKVAVIQDIIGRSGAQMLPFLKEYADNQNRITILTKEAIEQADVYADTQARARSQLSQYIGLIAATAAPTMTAFTQAITDTIKQFFNLDDVTKDLSDNTAVKDFAQNAALFLAHVADAAVTTVNAVRGVGTGLGALAAAAAAVLNMNLLDQESIASAGRQVRQIWKDWNEDAQRIMSAPSFVDNLKKRFAEMERASEDTGKKVGRNLAGYTSTDPNAKANAQAAREAQQAEREYTRLIEAIQKRRVEQEALAEGGKKLTEAEKFQLDTITAAYSANSKLTDSQRARVMAEMAATVAVMEGNQALALRRANLEQVTRAQDDWDKELEKQADEMRKGRADIDKMLAGQRESAAETERMNAAEAASLGMSEDARRRYLAAVIEDINLKKDLARVNATAFDSQEDREAKLAEVRENSARRLQGELTAIEIEGARDRYAQANDIAHSFFTDIYEDGENAFRNLGKSIKRYLIDALYELTMKRWIINIATSMSGGVAGAASGAASAMTGGGGLPAVFNGLSSVGGLLGSVGTFGSYAATGAMNLVAGGAGFLGNVGAGLSAGASLMGGGSIMGGLGMIAGTLGPIALGIYGLYKLFGSKKGGPKVEGSAGFGETERWGAQGNELDKNAQEAVRSLNDSYRRIAGMLGGTREMQFGVGLSMDPRGTAPSFIDITNSAGGSYRNRNVGRSEQELSAALADMSAYMIVESVRASGIDAEILAYFDKIGAGLSNEQRLQTLEQVSQLAKVRDALRTMGVTVAQLGSVSLDATANIVNFAGGIQNLQAGLAAYRQNFFDSEEQIRMGFEELANMMNAPGSGWQGASGDLLRSWDKDFFRTVVEGIDMTTEAGQRQFATMMNMAGAFASLEDAQIQAAEEAKQRAEQERREAEERQRQAQQEANARQAFNRLLWSNTYSLANFNSGVHEMNLAMLAAQHDGIDGLTQALQGLLGNFSTFREQRQAVGTELARAFSGAGAGYEHLRSPQTVMRMAREDFIQIFRTIDLNTNAGRNLASEMLRLQGAFASVTAEIREPSYYTVDSALAAINDVYEEQVGKARDLYDALKSANQAFDDFAASMMLDENLSTLTPGERFSESRNQYERARLQMEADGYSSDSVSRFTQAARGYLDQGRSMYGSGAEYQAIFDQVQQAMRTGQALTSSGMSDAERTIERLDAQVAQYRETNNILTSIDEGIRILNRVFRGELVVESTPWGTRGAGSYNGYASGLGRVPYDGFRATLHQGESVLTASEANMFRSGQGSALVSELQALRMEVARLRQENRQDAGNTIGATFEATQRAAQIQSDATIRAAMQRSYQSKSRPALS